MKKSKIVSFAIALVLTAQYAFASNISGIAGNNGVFNINPEIATGDTGFRHYENFYLSQGDIANLIFKYGTRGLDKFVNLVDNTINIQGIVNTMRDNNFYNGHAIFISPNGMIVGEGGVLNVGTLSVLTPTATTYDKLKENPKSFKLKNYQNETNADILIRGQVLARNNVNLQGANVILPEGSAIVNGVNGNIALTTNEQANELLFRSLVNIQDTELGAAKLRNGKIVIRSNSENGGANLRGDIYNLNNGSIKVVNVKGENGIKVTGNIYNKNGDLLLSNGSGQTLVKGTLMNSGGNLEIADKGKGIHLNSGSLLYNDGDIKITNKGKNGLSMYGDVISKGDTSVINYKGDLYVSGSIKADNSTVNIVNAAKNDSKMHIAGDANVISANKIYMQNNGNGGLFINGKVHADKDLNIVNQNGDLTLNTADVSVDDGNLILNNAGNKLAIASGANVHSKNGNVLIKNSGKDGMIIDGKVSKQGEGSVSLYNTNGMMKINGSVDVNDSTIGIVNNGKGIVIGKNAVIQNSGNSSLKIVNTGIDGLNVDGNIITGGKKDTILDNKAGKTIINGNIENDNATLMIADNAEGILINSDAEIKNQGVLNISNRGKNGLTIAGNVNNKGNAGIFNYKGDMKINGNIKLLGNSTANIVNAAKTNSSMNITGKVDSDNKVYIENKANGGMNIAGAINADKNLNIVNKAGDLTINNKISVKSGVLAVNNAGNSLKIKSDGIISNKDGNLVVKNSGKDGMVIEGKIAKAGNGVTSVYNTNGEMLINGTVDIKDGNLGIVNKGFGMVIGDNANISNFGNSSTVTNIINTGENGMTISGNVNTDKTLNIYNDNGKLTINGKINNQGSDTNILGRRNSTGIDITEKANISNILYFTDENGFVVTKPAYSGSVIIRNVTGEDGLTLSGNVFGQENVYCYK